MNPLEADSYHKIRADFEALKAKLKASVEQLDPAHYDEVVAAILSFDDTTIRERISRRRASVRIGKTMSDIERRLSVGEERERG